MDRRLSFISEDSRFDAVMEKIGTRGKFQTRYNILYNFLLVTATTMPYLNIILILSVPDHWCNVPGRENTNYTVEEWKNITLPKELDTRGIESISKCQMYNITSGPDSWLNNTNHTFPTVDCQNGWDYDRTWYKETAASQEDWVCGKELYVTNAFAFGRVGDVVGTFTFGQLGDIIGRRPVFYMTLATLICGRCLSAFTSYDFHLFLFATLLGSLTSTAVFQAPLIVAMEISDEKSRAHIAMLQCLGWTGGMCLLPIIYWMWPHWFPFMLITTLPCILFFFPCKMMIESPRWLASRGKPGKCLRQLEIIAKMNETRVPSDAFIHLRKKSEKTEKAFGVVSLFTSWRLAKNTLMLLVCWINGALAYYVIVLNVNALGGNPFLNFFWLGISELPAYVLGRISSDIYGRRLSQVTGYFLACIFCIPITMLISDLDQAITVIILSVIVKFWVSFVFYACNLQTLEIYPTCVRQSGLSLGAISASAFGILGPYVVFLGTSINVTYPYIILTALMLTGSLCAFFLPETLHEKLPETLAEAQVFGAHQKYFSLPRKPVEVNVIRK